LIFRRRANNIGTKNNFGLKKFPAEGGAEKAGGQKFPFPRPLSFFARPLLGCGGFAPDCRF
jgi:hypothetical protein